MRKVYAAILIGVIAFAVFGIVFMIFERTSYMIEKRVEYETRLQSLGFKLYATDDPVDPSFKLVELPTFDDFVVLLNEKHITVVLEYNVSTFGAFECNTVECVGQYIHEPLLIPKDGYVYLYEFKC